ncbi:hypothetical protein H2200_013566 [Cladophialophora chaetospira]|uniref:Uncharacterized protein n=1 Tax=Cladophialophora chaetospira TaxID=386627 RepID=A0AA38WPZ0_9EURO|nr:hypothetical protein H2200_013566 [Cladophialophora chaetospira]
MSAKHAAKRRKLAHVQPQHLIIDLTLSESEGEPSRRARKSKAAPRPSASEPEKAKSQPNNQLQLTSKQPEPSLDQVPPPLSAKARRILRPSKPSARKAKSQSERSSELLDAEKHGSDPQDDDAFNQFLNTLDGLDRETHLGCLTRSIIAAEKHVEATKIVTDTWGERYSNVLFEVKRTRKHANQVVAFEIDFDARSEKEKDKGEEYLNTKKYLRRRARRIERGTSLLDQVESLLEKEGRLFALTNQLRDTLTRLIGGVENLEGFWTMIWGISDDMNQAGPSRRPRHSRLAWNDHWETSLPGELARIETQIQRAEEEGEDAQIAIAMEALTEDELATLAWVEATIAEEDELPFAQLCAFKRKTAL